MTALSVSVVICAYTSGRWDAMCRAVESVMVNTVEPVEIVMVIDHNEVLLRRTRQHVGRGADDVAEGPAVRVVPNTRRRGLSGARNTGVEIAVGEVIAFLDDDAVADADWLARLLPHYADSEVVAVGGLARPIWPDQESGAVRPRILPSPASGGRGELDWIVGCTYEGQPKVASAVRNLMGCNMSFRRLVFDRIGGFNEELGRVGRTPLGCEETELCVRVRQDNATARIVFEPLAAVSHLVTPERVRWKYFISRCYSEGVSKAAMSKIVGQEAALESERRYATRVLPRAVRREVAQALRGRRSSLTGAAAIIVGLSVTTCGFLRGSLA